MRHTITKEYIESLIEHEAYNIYGLKTTVCFLILKNGFEVIGTSACVDPANFNKEVGRDIARQDAISKIWALEGYLLQEKLATA